MGTWDLLYLGRAPATGVTCDASRTAAPDRWRSDCPAVLPPTGSNRN